MSLHQVIVKRIKELCNEKGISINKMATICKVKQSSIDNILRGTSMSPQVNTILKICNGMGLTLGEFFSTSDFDSLKQ